VSLSTPKTAFSLAPTLPDFDPFLPLVIERDASDHAIAGIPSVRTKDGQVQPLVFFIRTLFGAGLNYDTHDKELLAILKAFKTRRHYLESRLHTIDVTTGYKNVE